MDNLPAYKPQKTWFMRRKSDDFIFSCEEKEAHFILTNGSNWRAKDMEIVGVSDGTTYQRVMGDQTKFKEDLVEEIRSLRSTLKRYRETEEKLKFDDLVEDDNEKLVKVRKFIDETDTKLEEKEQVFNNLEGSIRQKAFDAELEVARGNIERPVVSAVITPNANQAKRDKIINSMGV